MKYDRMGRRDFRQNFAPVKVGEELDVKIEALGEKGDGIAKKDGFVLFVPGTKQGDEVKIRVTRVLRKVGFAEVVGEKAGEDSGGEEASAEEAREESYETSEESQEAEEDYSGKDTEDFGEEGNQ